ncbi:MULTISPECIES: MOSC domain-containing protein [unclassified Mesorhizobium]|uniref:MOSC domain-containing protein n=1 Tax=unclassified Mesorhizobium TaxID=325217 RepID=UPI000464D4E1|nr:MULTISPECIES: MOSC domain-containing protein [unclassified Mesorhizobium]
MRVHSLGMVHVKCTRFFNIDNALITSSGIAGDRRFMLLDDQDCLISPSKHGLYLSLVARIGVDEARMSLTFPDGRKIEAPLTYGPAVTIDHLGIRQVEVTPVLGGWNAEFTAFSGRPTRLVRAQVPNGGVDIKPITLVSTASLAELSRRLGQPIDPRRFRCNLVIEAEHPHIEDSWAGRQLRLGEAILLVRSSVPRCIVTQLDPDTGANNLRSVPALMDYRPKVKIPDGLMPDYATPGFASYAEVVRPGRVWVGDRVELL